jgi:hypothetical protein
MNVFGPDKKDYLDKGFRLSDFTPTDAVLTSPNLSVVLSTEKATPFEVDGTLIQRNRTDNSLYFLSSDKLKLIRLTRNKTVEKLAEFESAVVSILYDQEDDEFVAKTDMDSDCLFRYAKKKVTKLPVETVSLYCLHKGVVFFKDFESNNCKAFKTSKAHAIQKFPFEVSSVLPLTAEYALCIDRQRLYIVDNQTLTFKS